MPGKIHNIRIETLAHEGKETRILFQRVGRKARCYESRLAQERAEDLVRTIVDGDAPGLEMELLVLPMSIVIDIWPVY